jgi:hypothetical protein
MDAVTNRTPCGRIPNTPLRNARHEAVAHACVQGMICREAGLAAGYKDGPGLKGNISRLRQTAVMRERIAEIAARAAALAHALIDLFRYDIKPKRKEDSRCHSHDPEERTSLRLPPRKPDHRNP